MYRTKFDFSWYCRKASRQIGQFTLISTLLLSSGAMYASGRTLATLNPNPNVSISINNGTMRSAIEKIEKSSGYVFVYNDDVKAYLGHHVSMRVKNQNIDEVVSNMLEGTNLSYRRSGRQITIYVNTNVSRSATSEPTRTSSPLQKTSTSPAPQQKNDKRTLKGKIIDSSNQPVIGATVTINGKNTGVVTDIDGEYTLPDVSSKDVIRYSYIGMKSQMIPVGDRTVINVTLQSDVNNLNDVVVVGYGTQRKESLTGSISMVDSKQLSVTPQISASNMLTGRVPGLIATQTYGVPGSDNATLSIRGFGNALFIVDGVERDARFIDPNTIETISVLKDASSAIYGSRAGNGVILITTKRGKSSKPVITASATLTLQSITALPKSVSSGQYAELKREEFYNKNGENTTLTPPFTEEQVQKYYAGNDPQYPNTDWSDLVLRSGAPMKQYNVSLRGGNDQFSYYSYLGYTKQESVFKTNFGNYKRYAFQTNLDAKVTDRLKLQVSMSYDSHDRNYPARNAYSGENSIWGSLWVSLPIYPASLPDPAYNSYGGGATGGIHLITDRDITGYSRSRSYTTNLSGSLTYDFKYVKGLSFKAFVDYTKSDSPTKTFHKPVNFYTYNYDNNEYTLHGSYYTKAA